MVKIRVFIPHLELKGIFEDVVKKLPQYDDVQIETTYVFGTPEVLAQNWDAEILVARGMTHDVLKELFPEKHVIRIQLSSFDIFEALVQCRHEHAKKIALCIHNIEINCLKDLEQACGASITIYDVQNEMTTEEAVSKALADGADIFVGAGTMCGICDRMGLKRIHIHTKHDAVEIAMLEALNTARTINLERARADIIRIMLNHSEEGVLAINGQGKIVNINNQAYRVFQLTTVGEVIGQPAEPLVSTVEWKDFLKNNSEKEKILRIKGKDYYVSVQTSE